MKDIAAASAVRVAPGEAERIAEDGGKIPGDMQRPGNGQATAKIPPGGTFDPQEAGPGGADLEHKYTTPSISQDPDPPESQNPRIPSFPDSRNLKSQYRKRNPRARLLRFSDLDTRTHAYRETLRAITAMESDLGGKGELSTAERQLIQNSAVLGALIGDISARYLKSGIRAINTAELALLMNSQLRIFQAIGIQRRQRNVTPSLSAYLDSKGNNHA
jgi:hypothetical protein